MPDRLRLLIDTAGWRIELALAADGRELARVERADGTTEALFALLAALFAEAGCRPAELAEIVACTGPGSFTGIRVGLAAAQGLAASLGIPARGVSRFAALAAAWATAHERGVALAAVQSRRDALFFQFFGDGVPRGEPVNATPAEIAPTVRAALSEAGVLTVLGDAALSLRAALEPLPGLAFAPELAGSTRAIGLVTELGPALPLYVRPPDATPPAPR